MLLSEIIQILMVRSGQFILGTTDLTNLGLEVGDLWAQFQEDLDEYERFFPLEKKVNVVTVTVSSTGNIYDFNYDPNNPGYQPPTTAPVVTTNGSAGSTPYGYVVAALINGSVFMVTSAGGIATGNATLSSMNSNQITWTAIPGATSYNVYRTLGGSNLGLIGTTTASVYTFADTGLAADGNKYLGVKAVAPATYEYFNPRALFQPVTNGNRPEFISKIVPVGFRQSMTNWWMFKRQRGFPGQMGRVPTPRQLIEQYRDGILYTSEPGKMDLETTYRRWTVPYYGDDQSLQDVEIQQLDKDKILLDVLYGRFLQIVGQSRSSIVHNDMPIIMNGAEMLELGNKYYDEAKKEMYERADWFKAVKP